MPAGLLIIVNQLKDIKIEYIKTKARHACNIIHSNNYAE